MKLRDPPMTKLGTKTETLSALNFCTQVRFHEKFQGLFQVYFRFFISKPFPHPSLFKDYDLFKNNFN